MRQYLDGRTMDDVAIERIRHFEPEALEMSPDGYWLAFSGGKDSVVILDLAKRAGVKFTAHQNLCGGVDPPELVWFTRRNHPEVALHRAEKTMWRIVQEQGCPPRRNARFCCKELKERGGSGWLVLTGVRWAESARRAKRQMTEACFRDGNKWFLHPIIDWSTADVWQYIRERGLAYCSLYDEGFKRLGCVLCPMTRDVERQIARWPRIAALWKRAIVGTFRPGHVGRSGKAFKSAEDYWRWWLDRDAPMTDYTEDSNVLFEDDPSKAE